jgi:hypothetical protein
MDLYTLTLGSSALPQLDFLGRVPMPELAGTVVGELLHPPRSPAMSQGWTI